MKKFNRDKKLAALGSVEMDQLRKELRERLSREELERSWHLEAVDSILTASQMDPLTFQRSWVLPLLAEGLSLDEAIAYIVEGFFQPN